MGGRNGDGARSNGGADDWVFDDDFVAGGIREDALRRARPLTDTPRNSLGNLPGPRDWTPRAPGGRSRRRSRWLLGLAAAVAVAGLVLVVATSDDHDPAPIVAAHPIVTASGTSTATPPVSVLSASTPSGTCLSGTAAGDRPVDVRLRSCRAPHDFEVLTVERAAGADDSYPASSYWDGPVAQRCYRDMRRYTGRSRDEWPDYLSSTEFIPLPSGWAAGDRVVYCIAQLAPAHAGSVRHLPAAHPTVIGSGTSEPRPVAAEDDRQTLTGRLYVQTHGSDVCLAVRSSRYTGPVEATVAGLSWRAAVDEQGRPDDAGSGIAAAREARADNIRWHVGDRVTLTGTRIDVPDGECGAASVFGFVRVTSGR